MLIIRILFYNNLMYIYFVVDILLLIGVFKMNRVVIVFKTFSLIGEKYVGN